MVNFAKVVLPTDVECRTVLEGLAQGPQSAGTLVQTLTSERQAFIFRALAWLVKLGVLKAG